MSRRVLGVSGVLRVDEIVPTPKIPKIHRTPETPKTLKTPRLL